MPFSIENNMVVQPAFQNVPLDSEQNLDVALLAHPRRRYISLKEIKDLACEKFNKFKKGITFADLKLGLRKRQAQRKLKDNCETRRALSIILIIRIDEEGKMMRYSRYLNLIWSTHHLAIMTLSLANFISYNESACSVDSF